MAGLHKAPAFGSIKVNLLLTATKGAAVGHGPQNPPECHGLSAMTLFALLLHIFLYSRHKNDLVR